MYRYKHFFINTVGIAWEKQFFKDYEKGRFLLYNFNNNRQVTIRYVILRKISWCTYK